MGRSCVGSVIVGSDFCVPATPPPFARALTLHVPYHMCLSLALYCISNPCTIVCTRFNKGFELELELVCVSWSPPLCLRSLRCTYAIWDGETVYCVCGPLPMFHHTCVGGRWVDVQRSYVRRIVHRHVYNGQSYNRLLKKKDICTIGQLLYNRTFVQQTFEKCRQRREWTDNFSIPLEPAKETIQT